MTVKRYWRQTALDTNVSYTNYDMVGQFSFTGVNTAQIMVNASMTLEMNEKNEGAVSTTTQNCAVTGTMASMSFAPTSGGCPTSGTCQLGVTLETQRDAHEPSASEWELMYSFENGMATASVAGATVDTVFTHQFCDGD
jgi:hypothetical protein